MEGVNWMQDDFARKAKDLGFSVQEMGDELLVYEKDRELAHYLAEPAAATWRAALTGEDVSGAEHAEALAELREKGLVPGVPGGLSRRQLVGKLAVAAAAAPLVLSVATPRAEAGGAGSGLPVLSACSKNNQCASNRCGDCCVPAGGTCCCAT